jgi:hypothetical protein
MAELVCERTAKRAPYGHLRGPRLREIPSSIDRAKVVEQPQRISV